MTYGSPLGSEVLASSRNFTGSRPCITGLLDQHVLTLGVVADERNQTDGYDRIVISSWLCSPHSGSLPADGGAFPTSQILPYESPCGSLFSSDTPKHRIAAVVDFSAYASTIGDFGLPQGSTTSHMRVTKHTRTLCPIPTNSPSDGEHGDTLPSGLKGWNDERPGS